MATAQPARIAIIIDDLGYEIAAGRRTVNLPGPVACAVLPDTPRGRDLAIEAHAAGKEVLLHLPLQAEFTGDAVEPGTIVLDTTREEFAAIFASSLASVPHVIGINSHKGSLLTRHPGHMAWLMEEIRARGNLLFVDSYTTHHSVALKIARENGIPSVRRDVFLDTDRDPESVQREFERLKRLAKSRGFAMGIGHPHAETLDLLERVLPGLQAEGIVLVSIGEYVALKNASTRVATAEPTVELAGTH